MEGPHDRPRSSERSFFRFCPHCAAELTRIQVDDRERAVCSICGYIQYRNPVVGVAAVIFEGAVLDLLGEHTTRYGLLDAGYRPSARGDRILLARRAISYRGRWCIPSGYVEYDESIREALQREMREEVGLVIEPGPVIAVESNFHQPDEQTVGIWFAAKPVAGRLRAGDDVDGLAFVDPLEQGLPLAFPTDQLVLDRLARMRAS